MIVELRSICSNGWNTEQYMLIIDFLGRKRLRTALSLGELLGDLAYFRELVPKRDAFKN